MTRFTTLFCLLFGFLFSDVNAQYELPDSTALENVFVEIYYVSDTLDVLDEDGGFLDTCSVTYRVYVDMKPDYELQAVFGNENNLLSISTATVFFNNEDRGDESGNNIGDNYLGDNTVALDSWVAMGGATESHWGVPKSSDSDGSLVGGANSDGGSEDVDGGILVAQHTDMGTPLYEADGLIEGEVPTVTSVGLELGVFGDENDGPVFETNSGAWSVLEGVMGPDDDNQVLIGQFTTQGEFSFKLNLQLGIPAELQCSHPDCHTTIQYVAELSSEDAVQSVETDNIFQHAALSFVSEPVICFPDVPSSISDIDLNESVIIYPNPAENQLTIEMDEARLTDARFSVYSSLGELVFSEANIKRTDSAHMIDVSLWTPGLYVLVIQSAGKLVSKEIIVQ